MRNWMLHRLAVLSLFASLGCGGGEIAFVGIGNSGNHVDIDPLRQVARTLDELGVVAAVSDQTLKGVYSAILRRAEAGDTQAALVVLQLAELQREDDAER